MPGQRGGEIHVSLYDLFFFLKRVGILEFPPDEVVCPSIHLCAPVWSSISAAPEVDCFHVTDTWGWKEAAEGHDFWCVLWPTCCEKMGTCSLGLKNVWSVSSFREHPLSWDPVNFWNGPALCAQNDPCGTYCGTCCSPCRHTLGPL